MNDIFLYDKRFESNSTFLRVPVYIYEISVVKNKSSIDFLGKTIFEYLKSENKIEKVKDMFLEKKSERIKNIVNEIRVFLGIGKEYEFLVENELKEIISSVGKKDIHKLMEYKDYYVFFNRMSGDIIPTLVDKEVFADKMIGGAPGLKIKINENYKLPPKKEIIENEITAMINSANKERTKDEDNEAIFFFGQDEYVNEIEIDTIKNINSADSANLLVYVIRDKFETDKISYEWPLTNGNSVYFERAVLDKIQDSSSIMDKLVEREARAFQNREESEKIKEITKTQKYISDNCCNMKKSKEVKDAVATILNNFESEKVKGIEVSIITAMNDLLKISLKRLCEGIGQCDFTLTNRSLRKALAIDRPNVLNKEILNSIQNINIYLKRGDKLLDVVEIKSILSYYLIIYFAAYDLEDDYAIRCVKLFENDEVILKTCEDIRKYRNNTMHRLDNNNRYEKKYDLKLINDKIETLKKCFNNLTYVISEFDKIIGQAT
ncbi:hypothetical protein [Oceanirhabdus seepicola]|uniref:Uncharacterized protein n=1 Tax=Oceanirhabdus seepicola TaxID=2828781 RepID=A0A9J6NXL6_9CLOT|nr:hypothetical protein [Oceanirhabdus seepicola]MCM1988804.1 hypothetical protein [Oceanirhabdus seepicola]